MFGGKINEEKELKAEEVLLSEVVSLKSVSGSRSHLAPSAVQ